MNEKSFRGWASRPFGESKKQAAKAPREPLASEMTLRDHFAGQALAGGVLFRDERYDASERATEAYEIADAMLAARNKQNG